MTELKTRTDSEPTAAAYAAEHAANQRQRLVRSRIRSVLKHAALIVVGLIMIYPLLWLVVSSFRPTEVIFRTPGLWINDLVLTNYTEGWFALNYPFTQYIINSTIVVVGAVAGNLFACSLAAYAFARLKFRLKTLWFAIMLMSIMLPVYVIVVPQYIVFNAAGLGEHVRTVDSAEVPRHRRVLRLLDGAVHPRYPARAGRGGPDRRLRALADLLPGDAAADGTGDRHLRDLHLHLDLE